MDVVNERPVEKGREDFEDDDLTTRRSMLDGKIIRFISPYTYMSNFLGFVNKYPISSFYS